MAEPFLAEVRIFPYSFAPRGWVYCDGELLLISQNTALFSLLGTNFGGDGRTTFGVPNLKGRAAMGTGNGPGLTPRRIGQLGGSETVSLNETQMANHTHASMAINNLANSMAPAGRGLSRTTGGTAYQTNSTSNLVQMASQTLESNGGNLPHNNMQPFLSLAFCIATVGLYPSRP